MSITDFGGKSKDEIIEYLIDEHNANEREKAQLRQELVETKETIEEFRRMIFASRSEKKHIGYENPEQLTLMDLFNEAELTADPNAEEPTVETIVKGYIRKQEGEKKKKASYKELYDKLPSRDLLCHLDPDAKICPQCGSTMERIGWEKVRTELEVIQAQIRLVNIYQETVRCQKCYEETGYARFARAAVPSPLIPHSPASPMTVAYVMYQKYINSMPLYRQEKEWKQMGVSIQRATLANWCMAGFVLKNTLSDNGGMTRGICKMDEQNNLTEVVETKNIVKTATGAEADGVAVDVNSLVSMNMWGLTPDFLTTLEEGFKEFFEKEVPGNPLKAEYLIPIFIGKLLEQEKMSVKVLKTNDTWYGMTYHEDVAAVKGSFKEMLENGVYKADLFSDL